MKPSEQAKAEAGLQLAEEIMDAFEHDGWPGVDYIADMIARYEALTVSAFPKIIAALGWQGGTVEQVVAEVGRLKFLADTVTLAARHVAGVQGQGVAALLPEHEANQ